MPFTYDIDPERDRAVGVNAVRLHLMSDYPVRSFYTVGEARAWLEEE